MRAIILGALALMLIGTAQAVHSPVAEAHAKHIDASCGMRKTRAVFPYKHRWHVRIGPKRHRAGRARCHGYRHKPGTNLALGGLSWLPFDTGSWSWRGVIDVGATTIFTSASCSTFVAALAGEVGTGGLDSPATYITGAACIAGGKRLQDQLRTHINPRG